MSNSIAPLLYNPDIQRMQMFCSDCIVNCYERYVKSQILEIENLKTNAAKEKRKGNIMEKKHFAISMFQTFNLPDVGHLNNIENIYKQYYPS